MKREAKVLWITIMVLSLAVLAGCGGGGGGNSSSDTDSPTTATASDFVGTWTGSYSTDIVFTGTSTVTETGSGNLTLALALNNSSLTGTLTDSNPNGFTTSNLTGITVTNGILSFPVPNTQTTNPDCANWNVTSSATLDSSLKNMDFNMSGMFAPNLAQANINQ